MGSLCGRDRDCLPCFCCRYLHMVKFQDKCFYLTKPFTHASWDPVQSLGTLGMIIAAPVIGLYRSWVGAPPCFIILGRRGGCVRASCG